MSDLRVNIGVTGAQQAAQALTTVEQKLNQTAKAGAKTTDALGRLPNTSNQATFALTNLSRIAQDAPFGFLGIANNLNPMLESFQRLKETSGSTGGALKAMVSQLTGPAGLGLAVGVVSSLLITFGDRIFGAGAAARKAKEEQSAYNKAVTEGINSIAEETARVAVLVKVIQDETLAKSKRVEAINELKKISPEYFNTLETERISVEAVTRAYSFYLAAIQRTIEAKALEAELVETVRKRIALERELDTGRFGPVLGQDGKVKEIRAFYDETGKANERQNELNKLLKSEGDLVQRLARLQKQVPVGTPVKIDGGTVRAKPDRVEIDLPPDIVITDLDFSIFDKQSKALNNFQKDVAGLQKTLGAGQPGQRQVPLVPRGLFASDEDAAKLTASLRELAEVGLVVGQVFADAFGALTEALFTGQNAIKAFANAFIQSLTQVISKLIQTAILAAIVSAISGGGAAIGAASNKFGDIFKFLLGFGGGRASGGGVVGGGSYLVGENGPEIFTPQVGGRIIPNGQLNSPLMTGGGGLSGGRVVIRGRELRLLGIRTQNSQLRLGGR